MFAVERGNIDLYALVFCLLAVWFDDPLARVGWLRQQPCRRVGPQLYPAILLS